MHGTPRIPPAEITGPYGYLVKRLSRKMLGDVPDSLGVMWHNRAVLNTSMTYGRKTRRWDQLDPHLRSFAHMAAASFIGCSACLDFGYFQAQDEGLDLTKASQVPRWRESSVFTALERDVMEYAEAMSQTPVAVTDELSDRLLDQLGAPALLELNAIVGFANLTARGNIALGITSEGLSDACAIPLAEPSRGYARSA